MRGTIRDHRPAPGPIYWRCLRCGHEVDQHRGWLAYWLRKRLRRTERA